MNFIENIIKMTKKRLKDTPFTSIFLIIGLTLAMLIISICVSFASEIITAINERDKAQPPNGKQYYALWNRDEANKTVGIENVFCNISGETGIIVNSLMMHVDDEDIDIYASASGEWFTHNDVWHYPLAEGRYYTVEEIERGEKVVLIGRNYEKHIYIENGIEYIDIENERYEVLGIVGTRGHTSLWDARLFMPCTALPEKIQKQCENNGGLGFIVYSNTEESLQQDVEIIQSNTKQLYTDGEVSYAGEIESKIGIGAVASDVIVAVAILGYMATMVYAVNIMVFWIEKRKKEIAVRKAVGYKDRHIIKLLLAEMIGVSGISFVLALLCQSVLKKFMDTIAGYNLKIYMSNVIVGVIVICLTAVITSALPVWKTLMVNPIEALKKG